eukprot:m.203218 g.203218  ORF g.203218 m.203218 type:complete len:696 (+) comp17070_c1_seq3:1605-3692(+)
MTEVFRTMTHWLVCVLVLSILPQHVESSRIYRHAELANTVIVVPDHSVMGNSVLLVNGRLTATCTARCCLVPHQYEETSSIHVYSFDLKSEKYTLLEGHTFEQLPPSSLADCHPIALASPKRPRVLAYFTVENTPSAQTYLNMTQNSGKDVLTTVETLIQSDSHLLLKDLCNTTGPIPVECKGVYHATPLINGQPQYCCFYRKRPNQAGLQPDCPNIESNMAWYASLFVSNGIDVLIPDTTNLGIYPAVQSDLLNVRPVEVVAEELTRLRNTGKATPNLAVWSVASAGSTMYTGLLPVYHNYTDVMLRSDNGTLIYFVDGDGNQNGPDANVTNAIKNDGLPIDIVQMWANLDTKRTNNGEWSFFQPCVDNATGKFTLTILNEESYRCNHLTTYNSALGSMASVSFAWQANYASLPFASPSKLMGLTFQAQFDDALRDKPDNLMMPSFNEWNSGSTQPNPAWAPGFGSVGLAQEDQTNLFVDIYAIERGRTWEPTYEAGDFYLRLAASCIRVATLLWSRPDTTCTVQNELCCNRTYARYNRVFSLSQDGQSFRSTINATLKQSLQAQGWAEICATAAGGYSTDYFCFHPGITNITGRQGPFILYEQAQVPPAEHAGHLDRIPRVAVWSCPSTNDHYTLSNECTVPGGELLGYAASKPSSAMPRKLRTCTATSGESYHLTDWPCPSGLQEAVLGHVL